MKKVMLKRNVKRKLVAILLKKMNKLMWQMPKLVPKNAKP
jgi:hypothetical protein